MTKKDGTIAILVSIFAVILALFAILQAPYVVREEIKKMEAEGETAIASQDVQYVLYLGTNDKDTNEPVFAPEEAKKKAEEILLKHFGGYTIQEADGGWIDGDTVYRENTLVIYLSDTNIESVYAACDEMIKTFNQSSVLVQENQTRTEFYSGN